MKLGLVYILVPLFAAPVLADTFGSGGNQFDINFVIIGNAGNAVDNTGYGSVGYTYQMGAYEVSRGMIEKYNNLSGGPVLTMYDMTSYGGNGVDRPASGVSWNEAARFVNWLNTSKGYSAAYKFTTGGFNANIALWTSGEAGYNAANPYRNANAYYFLPSEDEWYKAAFYAPNKGGVGVGGYWDFATGGDGAPTAVPSGTSSNTAVWNLGTFTGPADIANAGGLSPYGTMAQSGNVWEWSESAYVPPNDAAAEIRPIRGGSWAIPTSQGSQLSSSFRTGYPPTDETMRNVGFRVAAIPEPSGVVLALIGMVGVVLGRKR